MNEYISILKKRSSFRYLWLSSVISLAGDWFNTIASVIIVNRYTDTGLAISYVLIARTLPRFFFGPIAGVFADRFNRKSIMVISDLLRAGIVISFLFVDRAERVWLIYLLTFIQISVASFFEPASSALVPSLVKGEKELITGNVMQSITWSAMLAVGAGLGGGIAAWLGAEAALIIDSITFLLSAFLVLKIVMPKKVETQEESRLGFAGISDGLKYISKRIDVATLTTIKMMGQIGSGDIIIAVLAERYFNFGREGAISLGVMFAAAGLGAVVGPLLGNHFTDRSEKALKNLILLGYLIIPISWLVVTIAPNLWVASLGFLLRLIGASINWTYSNVLIQLKVPDNFLGRVFSLDMAFFTIASSLSIYLTGYFLDKYELDPRQLTLYFAIGGILPLIIWALNLLAERKRKISPI
ncbi:MAG: MFS transporter [Chloroflexi bacterium]|jgi:MFS family permease|nr:MFS transporter [Chloroflexota bacterium]MBT3670833.1 MFS transporter [Chloroflexota bacterium]MBT4002938.1 MFS transporter [Chloroflexota bacterium]MBT4305292.1 MFS transporter [Chloroflexota bacterium]MBT4532438.1 MFS transporter [Chloroflexota bacterium]